MVRAIYMFGVLALIGACNLLVHCVRIWREDLSSESSQSVVETFMSNAQGDRESVQEQRSPLIAQAEAFALFLNPPALPQKRVPVVHQERAPEPPQTPAVRPVVTTPKFKVIGTSCSESDPARSIALVIEVGSDESRWVREGDQLGHLMVHEIRPGAVVCQAGGELSEMLLEEAPEPTAVATGRLPEPESSSRATVSNSQPSRPARQPGRPDTTRARTVGSARTAALN